MRKSTYQKEIDNYLDCIKQTKKIRPFLDFADNHLLDPDNKPTVYLLVYYSSVDVTVFHGDREYVDEFLLYPIYNTFNCEPWKVEKKNNGSIHYRTIIRDLGLYVTVVSRDMTDCEIVPITTMVERTVYEVNCNGKEVAA